MIAKRRRRKKIAIAIIFTLVMLGATVGIYILESQADRPMLNAEIFHPTRQSDYNRESKSDAILNSTLEDSENQNSSLDNPTIIR